MKTITVRLTAPLQSYGNVATFGRRTTGHHPSKSAVIGMVAAALGYRREDPRIITLNQLHFAVRIDQVGQTMTDYQTVRFKKNTSKITFREYLQDAVFVIALGSEDTKLIEHIKFALQHPRFQLSLGRRANAPAGVLKIDLFSGMDPVTALEKLEWQASNWYQKKQRQETYTAEIIADADLLPMQRSTVAKDKVGSFDQRNRYHNFRATAKKQIKLKNPAYLVHDIMDAL